MNGSLIVNPRLSQKAVTHVGAILQAEEAAMRRNRIKTQESEIAALKKQLAGQKQDPFGGRTGGKTAHGVPSEYLCPITQVLSYSFLI